MSEFYLEPMPSTEALEPDRSRPRAWRRWPKRILVFLILLWIAAEGISLAIQRTRLRSILTAQFEATMGRPVEVGSYRFSFWGGPVVQARSVIVGEDPRFGAEYFLRTDSMAAHLRWRSLLHGRVEFSTIALTHPSLNLVRSSTGDWNLAEWLPRPSALPAPRGFAGPIAPPLPTRFHRIEIDGGRINFKLADEKLPFAFVNVTGAVEINGPGRWRLNLQATPWRAAVALQRAGTIQVSGNVGGTSSRLRPATIDVTWTGASLPDVLRLGRDNDFGLRGDLFLAIDARTDDTSDGWTVNSRAALQRLHRWDLALRPDNPSLNLAAQMVWRPSKPYLALTRATIEAPHSNLQASGSLYGDDQAWAGRRDPPTPQVVVSSAQIEASDLLAWARAFHSGIADNLSVHGLSLVDATVSGWPPRLVHAKLSTNGLDVSGAALQEPARVGRFELFYDRPDTEGSNSGVASFGPVSISWGSLLGRPDGLFRLEKVARPANRAVWRLYGSTNQIRDLVSGATAFGWGVASGWDVAGPFACDLRWQPARGVRFLEALRQPFGWMDLGLPASPSDGAVLRAPFLNLPIEQIKVRVDLKPGVRLARLISAGAFGAHWRGTFERQNLLEPWQFDLAADHLSSVDLDRWLNPRWRQSFLDRMLPFLNLRSAMSLAPDKLQAVGRLSVGRFVLDPLFVSDLQAEVELHGRHISLTNAAAQFYGGQVKGSFQAKFEPTPSYHADLDFSQVDASALIGTTPSLAGFAAESAAGQISFDAVGSTRADLLDSLVCQGNARVEGPELQNIHFSGSANAAPASGNVLRFSSGIAKFSCGQRKIQFQQIALQALDSETDGSGTVDFNREVDLRFETIRPTPASGSPFALTLRLAGTLPGLQAEQISTAAPRRAR